MQEPLFLVIASVLDVYPNQEQHQTVNRLLAPFGLTTSHNPCVFSVFAIKPNIDVGSFTSFADWEQLIGICFFKEFLPARRSYRD